MKKIRSEPTPSPAGAVQVNTWGDLERGDPVKVQGLQGRYRFCYHTTTSTGRTWITVYGGSGNPWGRQQYYSVDPSRVTRRKR